MNTFEFMGGHPVLTVILAVLGLRLLLQPFRCAAILFRGWPPAHVDADGDFCPGGEE